MLRGFGLALVFVAHLHGVVDRGLGPHLAGQSVDTSAAVHRVALENVRELLEIHGQWRQRQSRSCADEALEMIRTGCERDGKEYSAATYLLGSIPRLDGLGSKQFRTLIEAPGMPDLLSSCHHGLEDFIRSTAGGENPDELQGSSRLLQGAFERFCRKCEVPEGDRISLKITWVRNVSLGDVAGFLGASPGFEAGAGAPVFLSIAAG